MSFNELSHSRSADIPCNCNNHQKRLPASSSTNMLSTTTLRAWRSLKFTRMLTYSVVRARSEFPLCIDDWHSFCWLARPTYACYAVRSTQWTAYSIDSSCIHPFEFRLSIPRSWTTISLIAGKHSLFTSQNLMNIFTKFSAVEYSHRFPSAPSEYWDFELLYWLGPYLGTSLLLPFCLVRILLRIYIQL